jgi:trk system potassium uptake protein TrkH
MVGVSYLLSQALVGLALAMLLPAVVAFAAGEAPAGNAFVLTAILLGFLAAALMLALRGRARAIGRVGSYVLVLAIWVGTPAIAALPLMRAGGSDYLTALFESVSGFTTTGATALDRVGSVGLSGIFFRAELQWLGGLVTLVTIVTVLAASGLGGLTRSQVALVSGVEDRSGRLLASVGKVLFAYSAVTIVCVILLFISGIPPFEAVCIALSTVSTGGFMPIDGTFAAYDNPFANGVVATFMLIGATSVVWHRMVVQGRWQFVRAHRESYWVIAIAVLVSLIYVVAFADPLDPAGERGPHWITGGFLTGISLVSTTGFESHPAAMAAVPATLVLFLALIGASGLSTAGGLKYYRIGALLTLSGQELRSLIYPHSVRESRFGSIHYDFNMMKAIFGSLFVSLLVILATVILLSMSLPDFEAAMSAAIAGFSNIGPLYSAGWADPATWTPYSDFDVFAKLVFIAVMILGRLEVLVVFAAFNLAYWRS